MGERSKPDHLQIKSFSWMPVELAEDGGIVLPLPEACSPLSHRSRAYVRGLGATGLVVHDMPPGRGATGEVSHPMGQLVGEEGKVLDEISLSLCTGFTVSHGRSFMYHCRHTA